MRNKNNIDKLASLAHLYLDEKEKTKLDKDLDAILSFFDKLQELDANEPPLSHPLDQTQPYRIDKENNKSVVNELENIAPQFADNLYLVPKVIDESQ